MSLPTRQNWIDLANEGERKALLGDESEFIFRSLGGNAPTELTIAAGLVTAVQGLHSIDTESDAVLDTLTAMDVAALDDGALVGIYLQDETHRVTITHEGGAEGQFSTIDGESITLESGKELSIWRVVKGTPDTLQEVVRPAVANGFRAYTANAQLEFLRGGGGTNDGATGTISLTLPDAKLGRAQFFSVEAAFNLQVIPKGSDTIFDGASEEPTGVKSSTIGDLLSLFCTKAGIWRTRIEKGTWSSV